MQAAPPGTSPCVAFIFSIASFIMLMAGANLGFERAYTIKHWTQTTCAYRNGESTIHQHTFYITGTVPVEALNKESGKFENVTMLYPALEHKAHWFMDVYSNVYVWLASICSPGHHFQCYVNFDTKVGGVDFIHVQTPFWLIFFGSIGTLMTIIHIVVKICRSRY